MSIEDLRGTLAPQSAETPNFHLEQLGIDTIKHLLTLDLANKPEAQKPLVEFLRAMGVADEELATSSMVQKMLEQKAYGDMVKEKGGEAGDFIAHQ